MATEEMKAKKAERMKIKREEWKTKNLCLRCGKPRVEGRSTCERCTNHTTNQRAAWKQAGKCCWCGQDVTEGTAMCASCHLRHEQSREGQDKDKINETRRERRNVKKDNGICVSCESRMAVEGKSLCETCALRTKKTMEELREYRRQNGLCRHCGEATNEGFVACEKCRAKSREFRSSQEMKQRVVDRRAKKREDGICQTCSNPSHPGLSYCKVCQLKNVAASNLGNRSRWIDLQDLMEKQGNRCALSGQPIDITNAEIDHILPRAKGGQDVIENLQWTHKVTNRMKRDMNIYELIAWAKDIVEFNNN